MTNKTEIPADTQKKSATDLHTFKQPPKSVSYPLPAKRPLDGSSTSTSSLQEVQVNANDLETNTHDVKKSGLKKIRVEPNSKSLSKEELNAFLEPAKVHLYSGEKPAPCISFESLNELILKTVGNRNITGVVQKHCEDLSAVFELLADVRNLITERKLKVRITKIKNAIQKSADQLTPLESNNDIVDDFADISSSDWESTIEETQTPK